MDNLHRSSTAGEHRPVGGDPHIAARRAHPVQLVPLLLALLEGRRRPRGGTSAGLIEQAAICKKHGLPRDEIGRPRSSLWRHGLRAQALPLIPIDRAVDQAARQSGYDDYGRDDPFHRAVFLIFFFVFFFFGSIFFFGSM